MTRYTLVKLILFIILSTSESLCKQIEDFPLWGSSWVVADGSNQRIYPSVLTLIPSELCVIEFINETTNTKKKVKLHWSNYKKKDYWGTAEITGNVDRDLSSNQIKIEFDDINKHKGIDIAYQTYNDTLWTVNNEILRSFREEGYDYAEKTQGNVKKTYIRFGGGEEALKTELTDESGYSKEKPYAWVRKQKTYNEREKFTYEVWDEEEQKYFYYKQQNGSESNKENVPLTNGTITKVKSISKLDVSEDEISEYCDDEYYYLKIDESKAEFKTANIGYWQVHVYPEVWYYPRDYTDGKPFIHDDLKATIEAAMQKKAQSLDNPNDNDLKYWRDPYLCDSTSTIISFAFIEDGPLKERESIWLSGSAIGSTISFEHYPRKMYNVGRLGLRTAVLMLYSNGDEEESFARTLDTRCPGWEAIDEINGREIFPPNLRSNDGKYQKNWNVNDGVFTYNGCPCARESRLGNKTKVEVRKFIFKPVPTCSYDDMTYAKGFYTRMAPILIAPRDQQILSEKLTELNSVISVREENYKKLVIHYAGSFLGTTTGASAIAYEYLFKKKEESCPDNWVTIIRNLGL